MENEWQKAIKGKKCGFKYEGKKCTCTEIVGMARCRHMCKTHFNTVRKDNIRRFNKEQDIPKDLIFTKKLRNSETWSRFGGTLEDEKEVEKWE